MLLSKEGPMHGTLLYPLAVRPRLARPKRRLGGIPPNPKLPPDLRRRTSIWKRALLTELLRRAGLRAR